MSQPLGLVEEGVSLRCAAVSYRVDLCAADGDEQQLSDWVLLCKKELQTLSPVNNQCRP